jgi:hypothetical protein
MIDSIATAIQQTFANLLDSIFCPVVGGPENGHTISQFRQIKTYETFFVFTSSTISKIVSQSGSDKSPFVAFSANNVRDTHEKCTKQRQLCYVSPKSCLKFTIVVALAMTVRLPL